MCSDKQYLLRNLRGTPFPRDTLLQGAAINPAVTGASAVTGVVQVQAVATKVVPTANMETSPLALAVVHSREKPPCWLLAPFGCHCLQTDKRLNQ